MVAALTEIEMGRKMIQDLGHTLHFKEAKQYSYNNRDLLF